jgi:pyruvate/2-oxoglutarate dehydrogenase complex dihydrolipoamide acyltransferase (E2) component
MSAPDNKKLRIRKLSRQEIGSCRLNTINMLATSCDPFTDNIYSFNMEPCLACAREASERYGRHITFAHVLTKLLAVAIDENPVFNQVVFGRSMYQIEGVYISNVFMLPVKELALAVIVTDNAHRKTLAEIQQESLMSMVQKTREHAAPKNEWMLAAVTLFFRLRLNLLVSERLAFTVAFNKGFGSNIFLSNHDYGGPALFYNVKCITTVGKAVLRIHASPMGPQPFVDECGAVVSRETLKLNVIGDHRVINGVDYYRFGQSLKRLFASPATYLLQP